MKINQISPLEHDFTKVLETIALMPKTLYYVGKLPENVDILNNKREKQRPKCVAIVGARKNTSYGQEIAYQAAFKLAKEGIIIISGLAYGIDSIAHRGALDAGGRTIAILGSPIDEIYPRSHTRLAEEILEKDSAIISEYAPGERIYPKTSFLQRNRLISGLSDAVLVVEAAERSGSLNTASHALSEGKDLYAVPGDITRLSSVGCNHLISQGAYPYTKPEDIIDNLLPNNRRKPQKSSFSGTPIEKSILDEIKKGNRDGEQIIASLGIFPAEFNQAITMLEIKGIVFPLGMNNWGLK